MKQLYVIRHAKSSWDDTDLPDLERPLNERGKRDAPRMGKRLKEADAHPQLMVTSPAKRAYSTCKKIAEVLGYSIDAIRIEKRLYHASESEMLSVVRSLPDKFDTVLIFGHNPGLTDFVNAVDADDNLILNVPTCGVAQFRFDVNEWKAVDFGTGKLIKYDFPKSRQD